MKRWKLALSLAVVAAIAVPAIAGTWRLAPSKWVDLTDSQKQRISNLIDRTNNCTRFSDESEYEDSICRVAREQLANGGSYYPPERVTAKFLWKNAVAAGAAFLTVFALAMLTPIFGRQYLAWLRR
jgi:hypothetical protein